MELELAAPTALVQLESSSLLVRKRNVSDFFILPVVFFNIPDLTGPAASDFRLLACVVIWGPSRSCPQICAVLCGDCGRGLAPDVVIPPEPIQVPPEPPPATPENVV